VLYSGSCILITYFLNFLGQAHDTTNQPTTTLAQIRTIIQTCALAGTVSGVTAMYSYSIGRID